MKLTLACPGIKDRKVAENEKLIFLSFPTLFLNYTMRLILLLFLFYNTSIFAQDKDKNIRSFKISSTILKEDRFFDVYIPSSSKSKFEVIYVLDGQAQFINVVNALKQLNQNEKIVVGIGNVWLRDRDYTPTHVNSSPFLDSKAAAVSGGGKSFVSHVENELLPYIKSHYPVDTSAMLIGHSLGGLIAMDILLNHSYLFQKYLIIDPSMWWDDCKLLNQSKEILKKDFHPTFLFLAMANTRNKDKENIETIRNDTTLKTALIRPSLLLLDYLKANSKNKIKMDWKYYKDYDHMTVFQPAVKDGLMFLLK
jgi:predicted alpha/beta superfamily hydrolase